MKRILALILCIIMSLAIVACGENEAPEASVESTGGISDSSSVGTENSQDTVEIYNVTGKSFNVDVNTVNIAWDEDSAPTQYQQDTFISLVKTEFGASVITFLDENSFTLSGTNFGSHDFTALDCERSDNELFGEVPKRGNVDVLIYEDKVSFLCDFFNGWYFSIDYTVAE